ncbi:MAG TPA: response regulator [Thermoplasmatales archaeon]|nr:MAG: response regulator [Thermoplasmata archaeon]HDN50682.1 response regulator [Thermoplasmatales archaeon]
MSTRKVMLVVDDEKEVHELIKAYLPSSAFEIYSATNGEEGIRLYRKLMEENKRPDLVVMDLNLSGSTAFEAAKRQMEGKELDGVKTTREIMELDPEADVVGFTAYAHLDWARRLKALGVKEVFGREIGFDGFAKKVVETLA